MDRHYVKNLVAVIKHLASEASPIQHSWKNEEAGEYIGKFEVYGHDIESLLYICKELEETE